LPVAFVRTSPFMSKPLIALLIALLAGAASVGRAESPAALDLPQIGDPADNSLSPADEKRLGGEVMAELYGHNYMLEDPEISEYLSALGWKLAASSQSRPPSLLFFMMNDDRINAFALPGGFIGVNAGLLLAASNESEVAGVLGHELAHVTQRHIARTQEDTEVASMATWLAVIATIIAGSADPDLVIGALSLGQSLNYQRQVNYTRAHELEADRIGIQTMARAGFDPFAMASFFQKLEQQSRLYGSGVPEFLRTHPLNTTRVSEARARAASLASSVTPSFDPYSGSVVAQGLPSIPNGAPVNTAPPPHAPPTRADRARSALDFAVIQARTRVLSADRPSEALEYFSRELASHESTPARYGAALAMAELGQSAEAFAMLKPALEQNPRQANLNLLQGRLQLLAGTRDLALATLANTLAMYPEYAPAILAYADAQMAAGKPDDARQVLISHEQALGVQVETYNLLSQAARASGNMAEASYQMANFMFVRGDAGGALAQLDAGLRLSSLSKQDRSRLLARRQEVRATLPRNWRPTPPGRS
jgi:predicted Zn-dependent protease